MSTIFFSPGSNFSLCGEYNTNTLLSKSIGFLTLKWNFIVCDILLFVPFRMKCLLCDYITTDKKSLKEHYIEFHNVNKNNYFFKRLIDFKGNTFYQRQCQFCKEFVYENKVEHDFLKHYNDANIQSGGAAAAAAGYDDDDDDDDGNGSLKKPINIIDKQSIRKI